MAALQTDLITHFPDVTAHQPAPDLISSPALKWLNWDSRELNTTTSSKRNSVYTYPILTWYRPFPSSAPTNSIFGPEAHNKILGAMGILPRKHLKAYLSKMGIEDVQIDDETRKTISKTLFASALQIYENCKRFQFRHLYGAVETLKNHLPRKYTPSNTKGKVRGGKRVRRTANTINTHTSTVESKKHITHLAPILTRNAHQGTTNHPTPKTTHRDNSNYKGNGNQQNSNDSRTYTHRQNTENDHNQDTDYHHTQNRGKINEDTQTETCCRQTLTENAYDTIDQDNCNREENDQAKHPLKKTPLENRSKQKTINYNKQSNDDHRNTDHNRTLNPTPTRTATDVNQNTDDGHNHRYTHTPQKGRPPSTAARSNGTPHSSLPSNAERNGPLRAKKV